MGQMMGMTDTSYIEKRTFSIRAYYIEHARKISNKSQVPVLKKAAFKGNVFLKRLRFAEIFAFFT